MTLRSGQLRIWIARDELGRIHETEIGDSHFIVLCDPYENENGQKIVRLLENGQIYDFIDADHTGHWSMIVND